MTRNALSIIRISTIILLAVVIIGYTIFQAWKLIEGPIIVVAVPEDGAIYNSPLIEIDGLAKNAAYLYLDDRPIFTNKNGNFSEQLLLSPGLNIIKLDATDTFKRRTEKKIEVILTE